MHNLEENRHIIKTLTNLSQQVIPSYERKGHFAQEFVKKVR
jgi:hypothetical protein